MPILFLLLFGLIQYGFYFYAMQAGSHAANATARQLSVGNCQDASALTNFVQEQLGSAATAAPDVTTAYKQVDGNPGTATTSTGGTVTVTIDFPTIDMHLPLVPFPSDATITRSVTARVEDTTDEGCGS